MFNFMCRPPKIEKLLADELYQAQRETIGQEHKVHVLKLGLVQAEAALVVYRDREGDLESQVQTLASLNRISEMEAAERSTKKA